MSKNKIKRDQSSEQKNIISTKSSKTSFATGKFYIYFQEPKFKIDFPSLKLLEWWKFESLHAGKVFSDPAFSTGVCFLNDFKRSLNADNLMCTGLNLH